MAAAWCLPRDLSDKFLSAIRSGELSPERLMGMSSTERRAEFAKLLGEDNAREVNQQFEDKMLLRDQKKGLVAWAKKVSGITEAQRQDILTSISKFNRVLQPEDEQGFLADLAAKKLGVDVTAQEAKEIFDLAQKAEKLQADITAAGEGDYRKGWNEETGDAYGRARLALVDKINSLKPNGQTLANLLINLLNFPKSALTSVLHWSAPFVQGWGMISTRQWWSGLGKMFQYFASEDAYQGLEAYIISHPDYELARSSKLGLTHLGDRLTTREEAIQSSLLEQASEYLSERTGVADMIRSAPRPVKAMLGGDANLIRAWSRSFTGFLNYVRFGRFVDLVNAARLKGEDVSVGSKVANDLAKVVNDFSGRGELGEGDKYASIGPALNTIFFSPRKIVATVEMFNPVNYARLSPIAREAAAKQLMGSLIATGAVLTLAKVMGAGVNFDPRSSDFGKIDIGGEKLDMTGGNAAYVRFLARMATGQEVTRTGKLVDLTSGNPHGATRAEVAANFMRGKLAPVAAMIADWLYGKDPGGRAFDLGATARDELTPIVIDSFIKYFGNNPDDTAALIPSLSAILGVGLESPEPPLSESGRDVWGDPIPGVNRFWGTSPPSWLHDPVTQEARRLNVYLGFPMQTIRGVKLTEGQYDQYAQLSGRIAHARLDDLVRSPDWASYSDLAKASVFKHVISRARDTAETAIMVQSQGSDNDIMRKAAEAKLASAPIPQ